MNCAPTGRGHTLVFTWNNPTISLKELEDQARHAGAECFTGQLEKGEEGTPHFQFYLRFPNKRHFKAVAKLFPKCHVETAKNPVKSYEYCCKDDTRIEGPVHFGEVPKPRKNVKGDTLAFNQAVIKEGCERMVEDGRISIRDYLKIS